MKSRLVQVCVSLMAAVFSVGASATLITYTSILDANGVPTTAVSGATVVNFNDATCGAYVSCVGNHAFVSLPDLSGQYAAPFITATSSVDTTVYVSIPNPQQTGSTLFVLPTTANYFGLLWGSIDDYNSIAFLNGATVVASFGGIDITTPANGNQTAPSTNTYVNFFNVPTFNAVRISSTNFAFESDNHAWARVPEPGTLSLLGAGLLGLGLLRRRRAA